MLAEALAKLEGFTYAPSETRWWQHGHSSERDFICVTTQNLSAEQLQALSDEVGPEQSLLVCCSAFRGVTAARASERWPNLTLKKIPRMVLARCEWGQDDYSLNVANLPMAQLAKAEPAATVDNSKKIKNKNAALANAGQGGLFGERIMSTRVLHAVTGRLSLRPPQAESLSSSLARLMLRQLLGHERDVSAILSTLKAEFSTLEDFEREFRRCVSRWPRAWARRA